MTYPVVNEKRLKLLNKSSTEPTVLYEHLKTLKRQLNRYLLKEISIPKDVYDKIMEEYDLDYKRLELWKNKTEITTYRNLDISTYAGNLSSKEILDFVLEDGYDIDVIDEYRNDKSYNEIPNIIFTCGYNEIPNITFTYSYSRIFAFNKSNYIAKITLKYMQEKNKVILDNLAIVNKRMGLTL